MRRTRTWRSPWTRLVVLIGLVALIAAACAPADEPEELVEEPEGEVEEPDDKAQPVSEPVDVLISVGPPGVTGYMPFYVARDLGYFDDLEAQGVGIEIVEFSSGSDAALALFGGDTQFASITLFHVLKARLEGATPTFVLSQIDVPAMAVLGQAGVTGDPDDIRGSTIGVTSLGSATHLFGRQWLRQAGLNPDADADFVAVGGPSTAIEAFLGGQIDYLVHLDPALTVLLEEEGAELVIDARAPEGSIEVYGDLHVSAGLLVMEEFMEEHREVVEHVVGAIADAIGWLEDHADDPEAVAEAVDPDLGWSAEMIAAALPGVSDRGFIDDAAVDAVVDGLVVDGELPPDFWDRVDREAVYTNRFLPR